MMKIAVPTTAFLQPLIARADKVAAEHGVQIIRASEDECTRLLLANSADLALLSPLGYGSGVVTSDLRIVPTSACMLNGWTNVGSMYFAPSLREVDRIASPSPRDFLMQAAQILLDEQYEISAQLDKRDGAVEDLLKEFSSVIKWHDTADSTQSLDISEEWEMAFSYTLPVAVWVCRAELMYDSESGTQDPDSLLRTMTQAFAAADLQPKEERHETQSVGSADLRSGEIDWQWTEHFEPALNQTLQLLYFRQLIREIPAVKLVGRD